MIWTHRWYTSTTNDACVGASSNYYHDNDITTFPFFVNVGVIKLIGNVSSFSFSSDLVILITTTTMIESVF